jgi:LDH2 family malate/lactate/ureidoglycolate dehydrogenase
MQIARRHSVTQLTSFACELLIAAGCDQDKPRLIAEALVEADLLGHTTHGLQLLPSYMEELNAGTMARTGDVSVVSDRGAAVTWDGGMLPGVWLTRRAVDLAVERARRIGLCAIAVRRSHHIGCLAA